MSFGEATVLSFESSAGQLPRATPSALRSTRVTTRRVASRVTSHQDRYSAPREPTRVVAAPHEPVAARRAMEVIGALVAPKLREVLVLEPDRAAQLILERLAQWGYR